MILLGYEILIFGKLPSIMIFLVLLMVVLFLAFIRRAKTSLVDDVASLLGDIGNSRSPWTAKVLLVLGSYDRYFIHQGLKYILSTKKINMSCMGSNYHSMS